MAYLYPIFAIAVIPVVIGLVSLVVITLISALEKRLVWPYVPEQELPPGRVPAANSYAMVAGSAAAEAGFVWMGTYGDGKGKVYHVRYEFFVSPTGDVLALIGTGTLASIPVQTTSLYTLLADGRCLTTTDNQSSVDMDLTGMTEGKLAAGIGFFALLQMHRARAASAPVKLFTAPNPLTELRAYRRDRTERLCGLGYASFLDADRSAWRYSVKGAFMLAFRQYFTGMRRAIVPDRIRTAEGGRKLF